MSRRSAKTSTEPAQPSPIRAGVRAVQPSAQAVLVEPRPRPIDGWTPALIKAAERSANNGDLSRAADMAELLIADEHMSGLVSTLAGVASLPLTFGDAPDSPIAQALEKDFWRFFPETLAQEVIGWLRVLGVCFLHVKRWQLDEETGRVLPELEVWHPRSFRFDWPTRRWVAKLDLGKERSITAGDGNWLVLTSYDALRPWSKAPWRMLSRLYLLKRHAIDDWGFYSNRHGNAPLVAESSADNFGLSPDARVQLTTELRQLARNSTLALPQGFSLKLLEATARSWETFEKQIAVCDVASSIALTGNNLGSQVSGGGSYAAASVHEKVTAGRIRSIAEILSTGLREQLLVWYAQYNFGMTPAPYPHWDTRSPADQAKLAAIYQAIAQALSTARSQGYELDLEEIQAFFGITVRAGSPPMGGQLSASGDLAERALLMRAQTADDRFATALADGAIDAGAESLAPQVDELLRLIDNTPEDDPVALRAKLLEYYRDASNEDFAVVTERAMLLANLRGRRAAVRDV
jgi:phage gp29-like protein